MKNLTRFCFCLLVLSGPILASDFYGVSDPHMGSYEGFWQTKKGAKGRMTAQIRPVSNNKYDGFVLLTRQRGPVTAVELAPAAAEQEGIKFSGATGRQESQGDLLGKSQIECELKNGKLTGKITGDLGEGTFEASKVERKSKTMGAKPPKHAIVLFDGKEANGWSDFHWKITRDGAMEITKGDIHATEQVGSFKLHLEFRTPYMPAALGQERGNSGVYLQSKYEVQVLDSFGIYPLQNNDCGAVYSVKAPQLNACFAPMNWQTFDITYIENKGQPPVVTVVQNGMTVIDHLKIPENVVKAGTGGSEDNGGFLKLQDHGNAVQYRNIWAEPLFSSAKKK